MDYRPVRQLARGGFSEVFEVEDTRAALAERLVLKRLSREMSTRPEVHRAFAEEARILRDLKHRNVVTFRRCFYDEEGRICLLMERVDGEPLNDWLARRRVEPEVVLDLFGRIVNAVDYLHHRPQPFLHLDLKPENILVSEASGRPEPVLIDFGIARSLGGSGLKAYTPPYGAPEQRLGRRLGCYTDVFALGQILTELVDGLGDHLPAAARAALSRVAARATHPSRPRRHPDAGALEADFRRGRSLSREATTIGRPPPRQRLRAWIAAGATVLLLAMAAALANLGGFGQVDEPPESLEGEASETRTGSPGQETVDRAGLETEFDRYIQEGYQALDRVSLSRAEESYKRARRLLERVDDEDTRRSLERQLSAFKQAIDLRHTRYTGQEPP